MVTMQDIAKEAGVSRSAVSFVLNKNKLSESISENTRKRIEKAAARLEYAPDEIARSMASGKTKTLGLIVDHHIETEYGAKMVAGLMKRAGERGYFIKLYRSNNDDLKEFLNFCISQRLAGVILRSGMSLENQEKFHRELAKRNVPLAFFAAVDVIPKGIQVMSNDYQGGKLVFEHLYELGHRRFMLISRHSGLYVNERMGGFLDAMENAGIKKDEEHVFLVKGVGQEQISKKLKKMSNNPTAIFCCSDYLAATVLTNLLANGVKVPEDISLVGYGKLRFTEFLAPALTTIEEFQDNQAARAIDLLLESIENGDRTCFKDKICESIDVKLIARQSTTLVETAKKKGVKK
jgi:LacI family transcriptional regulator, galactose operon repressor